jgi:hypothetical protein
VVVKKAVGEWTAKLFVEEHEHESDPGSFVGEPVGIAFAIAFRQPVRLHFAEIAAKLIQTVAIGGYAEGCEYCVVDVFGSPATHRSAAVQEGFMRRIMRVSWILMPGNFAVSAVMGKARRCSRGKST